MTTLMLVGATGLVGGAVLRLARQHGMRAFGLNSATGADPRSGFFYIRIIRRRGTEQAVIKNFREAP